MTHAHFHGDLGGKLAAAVGVSLEHATSGRKLASPKYGKLTPSRLNISNFIVGLLLRESSSTAGEVGHGVGTNSTARKKFPDVESFLSA